jgi:DNA-binding CsgD family transcriptional regulator
VGKGVSYSAEEVSAIVRATAPDLVDGTLAEHATEALAHLKKAIRFSSYNVFLVRAGGVAVPLCAEGLDMAGLQDYVAYYVKTDPMRTEFGNPASTASTLSTCARRVGMDLRRSEYVNDYTLPRFSITHILGSNFLLEDDLTFTFAVHREKKLGDFGQRELQLLQIALPPLARSLRLTQSRVNAMEGLRASGVTTAKEEAKGLAVLNDKLEVDNATPWARDVLRELGEKGELPEILMTASLVLRRLSDKRCFADESLVRRIASGAVSIRIIATRARPSERAAVYFFIEEARSRLEHVIARMAQPYRLTDREVEIVCLIHEGLNQPAVAERLGISAATVRDHITSVRTKLRVRTNAQILTRLLGLG